MKPKHMAIFEYVMEKIESGEWPVGYMLPAEIELCRQFGLSRPSVRTALLNVANDGYLVRTKGKGTFVTMPQRIEESTLFIESFAEEMHKSGIDATTEVLELRIMIPGKPVLDNLRLPETAASSS